MKRAILELVAILFIIVMVNGTNAQVITEPCEINLPGEYFLGNDIFGEIIVNVKNVIISNPDNYKLVSYNGIGVQINADSVLVKGLIFENWDTGISVGSYSQQVTGCRIDSCSFLEHYFGVYISYSNGNQVTNCEFTDCGFQGIYISVSDSNLVFGNRISNTTNCGITMTHSNFNNLSKNSGEGNWVYGIALDETCTANFGQDNTISGLQGNFGLDMYGNNISCSDPTGLESEQNIISGFILHQNFPNPFNPTTTITYEVPIHSWISLRLYNSLGQEITTLVNEEKSPGVHSTVWSARDMTPGIYFYHLQSKGSTQVRKMTLIK